MEPKRNSETNPRDSAERSSDRAGETPSRESADRISDRVGETASRVSADRTSDRAGETPSRVSADRTSDRVGETPSRETADRVPDSVRRETEQRTTERARRTSTRETGQRPSKARASFNEAVEKFHYPQKDELEDRAFRKGRLSSTPDYLDDYNPMDHREPIQPIKPWMAYLNVIRTLLGPGMLFMPLAISQAGIILGPLLLLLVVCIVIHTNLLLLESLTEVCRELRSPYISYRYGFRLALLRGPPLFHFLGEAGPTIITLVVFLTQLGICTVYVLVISFCLRDLFDWHTLDPAMLILLPLFLVLVHYSRSLTIASYFSFFGSIFSVTGLLLLVYFSFNDVSGKAKAAATDLGNVFWFMGACLFNLSAIAVILSMDKALKKPQTMRGKCGTVVVGLFIPTLISGAFGVLACCAFGVVEENILLSLPLDDVYPTYILALYIISVSCTYPVQCYPAISGVTELIKHHDPRSVPLEKTLDRIKSVCRPIFVTLTFVTAYFIPYTGVFVAFVGNQCTSLLAVVFPVIMDTCLRYPDNYGHNYVHLIKNVFIMILGLFVWIFGIYYCVSLLTIRMLADKDMPEHHQFY